LLVLLALALALRLVLLTTNSGLTMDSPLYVRMAERLLAGQREASPAHHGYPMLVALASLVLPGRELPGRLVSLAASLVLVLGVWLLARRRAGTWAAAAATLPVALHPLLAVYGVAVMTEATFLAVVLGGLVLLDRERTRSGAALLGAAWWVRPEAAVIAPLALLFTRGPWRTRAIALLVAAGVALPYTAVLRAEQGYWSFTPKTALVRAPFASGRAAEWRLGDSTAFADTVGIGARLARDGGAIVRGYPAGLAAQCRALLGAWPWGLLIVSLLGLAMAAGRGPWLALLALPFVYPLLSAPADLRFAQMVLPALAVPLAPALARALEPRGARWRGALVIVWLALSLGSLAWGSSGRLARGFDDGPMAALRGAGAWLAAHTPDDAVIMDRKSYVPFFANRRHVQLPDEPLDVLLDYARSSGATHIVVEEYVVAALRPQLAPLLDQRAMANEPRVRLVFALRPAPGDGVAVLEVVRAPR
jgi:hypothetical protein